MRARSWGAFGAVALAGFGAVAACVGEGASVDGDVDSRRPPTEGDGGGGDGGLKVMPDAAPPLGCPLGCLPPAPAGWIGPSALYDGPETADPLACPVEYPQREVDAYQGVTAPPAVCTCGQGTPEGSKCEVTAMAWAHPNDTCSGPGAPITAEVGPNVPVSKWCLARTSSTDSFMVTGRTFKPGTCSYAPPAKTVPKRTFETMNVACGLAQIAACEGRPDCTATPTPTSGFTRLCIHKEGEHLCPSLDYAVQIVAYRTENEGRDCSACEGRVTGGCGSTYHESSNANCSTTLPDSEQAFDACNPMANSYADLRGLGPTGEACEKTGGGEPIGELSLTDPVTFCCNK